MNLNLKILKKPEMLKYLEWFLRREAIKIT